MPDQIASIGGYGISQQMRKYIEQRIGCAKFIGPTIRQVLVRGLKTVDQLFVLKMAEFDSVKPIVEDLSETLQ